MTALLAFLKFSWPYVLCTLVGIYLSHRLIDVPRYDALQTKFATYQLEVADANAKAQEAARNAVQAQIQTRIQTEANNEAVIEKLQMERDRAMSDRTIAERLLIAAKTSFSPPSSHLSQATDRPSTPAASPPDSRGSLAEALTAAIDECRSNADQLDALIAELQPQL